MFMRVSARLHAKAAPDAPAPMISTSTGSSDMSRERPPPPTVSVDGTRQSNGAKSPASRASAN